MTHHRFTENETGVEVDIEVAEGWDPFPLYCFITYPCGRKYAMPEAESHKHFTIVSPQEILVAAHGSTDRPTKLQWKRSGKRKHKPHGG